MESKLSFSIGSIVEFVYHDKLRIVEVQSHGIGQKSGLEYIRGKDLHPDGRQASTYNVCKMEMIG